MPRRGRRSRRRNHHHRASSTLDRRHRRPRPEPLRLDSLSRDLILVRRPVRERPTRNRERRLRRLHRAILGPRLPEVLRDTPLHRSLSRTITTVTVRVPDSHVLRRINRDPIRVQVDRSKRRHNRRDRVRRQPVRRQRRLRTIVRHRTHPVLVRPSPRIVVRQRRPRLTRCQGLPRTTIDATLKLILHRVTRRSIVVVVRRLSIHNHRITGGVHMRMNRRRTSRRRANVLRTVILRTPPSRVIRPHMVVVHPVRLDTVVVVLRGLRRQPVHNSAAVVPSATIDPLIPDHTHRTHRGTSRRHPRPRDLRATIIDVRRRTVTLLGRFRVRARRNTRLHRHGRRQPVICPRDLCIERPRTRRRAVLAATIVVRVRTSRNQEDVIVRVAITAMIVVKVNRAINRTRHMQRRIIVGVCPDRAVILHRRSRSTLTMTDVLPINGDADLDALEPITQSPAPLNAHAGTTPLPDTPRLATL